jgi:hypothetical protein
VSITAVVTVAVALGSMLLMPVDVPSVKDVSTGVATTQLLTVRSLYLSGPEEAFGPSWNSQPGINASPARISTLPIIMRARLLGAGGQPTGEILRWRGMSFDHYDGRRWSPRDSGAVLGTAMRMRLHLQKR